MNAHTIAAIATPAGASGIGVIRISGSDSIATAQKIFQSRSDKPLSSMSGYQGILGYIISDGQKVDEAIATVFCAPKSYTGEDIVELSCHGGMWVMQRVLQLCLENGAEMAEPGEFTKRAFLNGKLDLTQAEAVMEIIGTKGDRALKAAMNAREGKLSTGIKKIVESLLGQSAHLAAWADYPEEEIEVVDYRLLLESLSQLKLQIEKLLGSYDTGNILMHGIDTVIAGKPNVGKSTLMNFFSGTDRSIVTEIPGTTRDVVTDFVIVEGIALKLSDTAGIRETYDPVEQLGVGKAKQLVGQSQLVLAVFDGSQQLDEQDKELLELLSHKTAIALINKTDLEQQLDIDFIKAKLPRCVEISARTGEGLAQLAGLIRELAGTEEMDSSATLVFTQRQQRHLQQAAAHLEEGIQALEQQVTLDAVNTCIDCALDSLLSLTGQRASEQVIDEVFSRFCVGK